VKALVEPEIAHGVHRTEAAMLLGAISLLYPVQEDITWMDHRSKRKMVGCK